MSSSLLSISSTFASDSVQNKRIVKGFVSVELIDRSGDRVPPESFNLDNFANNKQLWLNHRLIKEYDNTESAAGLITLATASYIDSENPNNREEWVINRIETDEFVSFFPKSQVPDLIPGDKGLFVVAEVTHEKAIQKVDTGEVMAFSWQGRSKFVDNPDGSKTLTDIDLIEMSLVNVGDNNQANFVIVDPKNPEFNSEISIKECVPYKLRFEKEKYTEENVQTYIKKYHPDKQISQSEDNFYVQLAETSDVVVDSAFNYTNNLVAAPMKMKMNNIVTKFTDKEDIMSEDQKVAGEQSRQKQTVKYYMVNKHAFDLLVPSAKVRENVKSFTIEEENGTLEASVDLLEIPQETVDAAIERSVAVNTVVDDDSAVNDEHSAEEDTVNEETSLESSSEDSEVTNNSANDERFNRLEQGMVALAQGIATLTNLQTEKAKKEQEAIEAVKQAQITAQKEATAKSQAEFDAMIRPLVSNAVPDQTPRKENVQVAKSFGTNENLSKQVLSEAALSLFFNKSVNSAGAK